MRRLTGVVLAAALLLAGAGGATAELPGATQVGTVLELPPEPGAPRTEQLLSVDGVLYPTQTEHPAGTQVEVERRGDGYDVVGPAPVQPTADVVSDGDTTHRLTVVMYTVAGVAPDKTLAQALAAVQQAGDYWRTQSRGDVDFQVVRSVDWVTGTRRCNDSGFYNEVASRGGFTSGRNNHVLAVLPLALYRDGSCSLGRASVGSGVTSGGYGHVVDDNWSDIAHELGHNLSLLHANVLGCSTASGDVAFPSTAGCSTTEYADHFSVMASSGTYVGRGSVGGAHFEHLGLNTATPAVSGTADTTVTLGALGLHDPAHPRSVEVVAGSDTYWLEYRAQTGHDALLGASGMGYAYGVRVTKALPSDPGASLLIDPTPSANGSRDHKEVLTTTPWTSATGRVRLTLQAMSAQTATVRVEVGETALTPQTGGTPSAPPVAPSHVLRGAVSNDLTQAGKTYAAVGSLTTGLVGVKSVPVAVQLRGADGTWTTLKTGRTNAAGVVSLGGLKAPGAVAATATVRLAVVADGKHAVPESVVSDDIRLNITTERVDQRLPTGGPYRATVSVSSSRVEVGKPYTVTTAVFSRSSVAVRGHAVSLRAVVDGGQTTDEITVLKPLRTGAAGLATFTLKATSVPVSLTVTHGEGAGQTTLGVPRVEVFAPVAVAKAPR